MENQIKQPPHPPPDSVSSPPHSKRDSGEHISLSPPVGSPGNSPADSYSSPLHSKHDSGEHISISPARSSLASDHTNANNSRGSSPENEKLNSPAAVVSRDVFKEPTENMRVVLEEPMAVVERAVLEEPKAAVAKTDSGPGVVEGGGGGGGSGRRKSRPSLSILRGAKKEKMVKKAALGFRIFGFLFCLVSFSVMAADRNQGWALDSFDRYREFRYCMSVNVIGFVYSGAQAFDLSYNLVTGKYIAHHQQHFRYYFDFAVDQLILVSAALGMILIVCSPVELVCWSCLKSYSYGFVGLISFMFHGISYGRESPKGHLFVELLFANILFFFLTGRLTLPACPPAFTF